MVTCKYSSNLSTVVLNCVDDVAICRNVSLLFPLIPDLRQFPPLALHNNEQQDLHNYDDPNAQSCRVTFSLVDIHSICI